MCGFSHIIKGAPFGVGFGCLPQSLRKGTPSMDSKKYIGYVAFDIADTMWPSRLCRVAAWLPVCELFDVCFLDIVLVLPFDNAGARGEPDGAIFQRSPHATGKTSRSVRPAHRRVCGAVERARLLPTVRLSATSACRRTQSVDAAARSRC